MSTRWTSLVQSAQRFFNILPSFLKALNHKELKSNILWNNNDTEVLSEIVDVLEPARVATIYLSNSSINLLTGEGILKFLIKEVNGIKNREGSKELVKKFSDAIEKRLQLDFVLE